MLSRWEKNVVSYKAKCLPMDKPPAVIFVQYSPKNSKHEIVHIIRRCFGLKILSIDELIRRSRTVKIISDNARREIKKADVIAMRRESGDSILRGMPPIIRKGSLVTANYPTYRDATYFSEMDFSRSVVKENIERFTASFVFDSLHSSLSKEQGYIIDLMPTLRDLQLAEYLHEDLTQDLIKFEIDYPINFLLLIKVLKKNKSMQGLTNTKKVFVSSDAAMNSLNRYFSRAKRIVKLKIRGDHLHECWKRVEDFMLSFNFRQVDRYFSLIILDFGRLSEETKDYPFKDCLVKPTVIVLKEICQNPFGKLVDILWTIRTYLKQAKSSSDIFLLRVDETTLKVLHDNPKEIVKKRNSVFFTNKGALSEYLPKTIHCKLSSIQRSKVYNVFSSVNNETFFFPLELDSNLVMTLSKAYADLDTDNSG